MPVVYVGDGIDCVSAAVDEPFVYNGSDHFAVIPREALRPETTPQVRRGNACSQNAAVNHNALARLRRVVLHVNLHTMPVLAFIGILLRLHPRTLRRHHVLTDEHSVLLNAQQFELRVDAVNGRRLG